MNDSQRAEMRPVDVGDWYEDNWFIDEGLASGDRVVVDGALRLAPGAAVDVKDAAGSSSTTPSTSTTSK